MIEYFGKIPARGDFVKSAQDIPLMSALDEWLAQLMQRLPVNPRWKLYYDAQEAIPFALLAPQRRHAIGGTIFASRDGAGRRYPFLLMRSLYLSDPLAFSTCAPLALAPLWQGCGQLGRVALAVADPGAALAAIRAATLDPVPQAGRTLAAYIATASVESLEEQLGDINLRQLILALGMLLQPAYQHGIAALARSLVLPLPQEAAARAEVAAFWLELVQPMLPAASLELALFYATIEGRPSLVLGFRGACAETLQAIIDPSQRAAQQINLADTGWVDAEVDSDTDMRALASYLEQPRLPLRLARELYLQTFTGTTS